MYGGKTHLNRVSRNWAVNAKRARRKNGRSGSGPQGRCTLQINGGPEAGGRRWRGGGTARQMALGYSGKLLIRRAGFVGGRRATLKRA